MPRCSGYTAKKNKCKIICKNKYCRYHCKGKRTGGGMGKEIMTKPDYFNSKGGKKKQKGGLNGIYRLSKNKRRTGLYNPRSKSRFLVSPIPRPRPKPRPKPKSKPKKKRPTVSFAETMSVVTIPKNDCPKDKRPRLKKVALTEAEKKEDIKHLGRARRKKYKLLCRNPKHTIYSKKSGFKCCSLPKEGGAKAKKKKRTKK